MDDHPDNISSAYITKEPVLRSVVATVCFLSMVGSLLIILSYVCIKDIRTRARHILVHLSLADFGVACSNFIGLTVYFDQYIRNCNDTTSSAPHISCATLHHLCTTQAFFAGYSTLVSILWTLFLAVYIYCLIVHSQPGLRLKVVYFGYVFCWGMPLLVALWLLFTDRLGYTPHGGSGWCSLKVEDANGNRSIFIVVFGNDLWIYLTFVMVTILYFTTHCHLRTEAVNDSNPFLVSGSHQSSAVNLADRKFLFIPFAFLFLRIWTEILLTLYVYAGYEPKSPLADILLYLSGIGDSGQGLVNAIIFCLFTPKVRHKLLCCCYGARGPCTCCRREQSLDLQTSSSEGRLDSFYGAALEGSRDAVSKK